MRITILLPWTMEKMTNAVKLLLVGANENWTQDCCNDKLQMSHFTKVIWKPQINKHYTFLNACTLYVWNSPLMHNIIL